MAQSKCFSPVRGRAMRVTKLDGCGRPVYGPDSVGVSDGFVSISFTANTDEGEEINVTNAAGKTCVRETPCPTFLGYGVEIEFCSVDPALLALMTGQEPVTDPNGVQSGFRVNSDVSACDSGFALEVWTGTPGVACDDNATGEQCSGGYLLLPYMQGGIFGDFTIENGAISFTITGAATKTGSGWGVGPYDVVNDADGEAGGLYEPIASGDHLHVEVTTVCPPEPSCGTKPLLPPDDPDLTDVTPTVSGMDATFTPVPAGDAAWWIDFGDGTWDYSEDGSDIEHTYSQPGTYTVTAYRGSSSVSVDVVIEDTPAEAPTLTAVSPTSGPLAGGTEVTLTGTNFEA
jgi:hypothetical protein